MCSLPTEYCEFGPKFQECKLSFQQNWKALVQNPENLTESDLVEIMTKLGLEGEPDQHAMKARKALRQTKTQDAEAGDAPAQEDHQPAKASKKKKEAKREVVVELTNRNKKKFVTIIKGLEPYGLDLAPLAKAMGKKFACGAALQKGKAGSVDQIEVQGNCADECPRFLHEKYGVPMEELFVLEGGSKCPASQYVPKK